MTLRKRLQRIETSLTPREAGLLWLKGMLELSHESYLEKVFADPRNPRVLLLKAVAEAVRENLSDPPKKIEELEQAVREGQKQADMPIILVMNLHDHVRSECRLNEPYAKLIHEKFRRMLLELVYRDKVESDDWDSWRELLITRLMAMWELKETVVSISAKYYDSHPLLFPEDEDNLRYGVVFLEAMTKFYNDCVRDLPAGKTINIDAQSSAMRERVEKQIERQIVLAKAKTLTDFGEEEAARELMDSYAFRALRELKRLRSSSSREDTLTSYFRSQKCDF